MNTKEGGAKTSKTIRARHGNDYWSKVGALGGKAKVKKGFACATPEQRKAWGAKGGRVSRRTGNSSLGLVCG